MDDKTLMKLSAIIAIAGLIALVFAAQFAEPQRVAINSISKDIVGRNVEVNGTVESMSVRDGNVFIALNDSTGVIDVVMFEQEARNTEAYTIKKGDFVAVAGKINFYRGGLEIVASFLQRI